MGATFMDALDPTELARAGRLLERRVMAIGPGSRAGVVSAVFAVLLAMAGPGQSWAQPLELGGACDGAGGVGLHRAVPGRRFGETVCVPRSVWFAQQFAASPVFSDRQLADYATGDLDPDHLPDRDAIIASYRGALVRVEFPCQYACGTPRIIYLDPPPGKGCADDGGVETTIVTPEDFGSQQLSYCVPKVVLDAQAQRP
jgi:hypothetical protein